MYNHLKQGDSAGLKSAHLLPLMGCLVKVKWPRLHLDCSLIGGPAANYGTQVASLQQLWMGSLGLGTVPVRSLIVSGTE